jgi:ATP-binding cassette subfamily B protein
VRAVVDRRVRAVRRSDWRLLRRVLRELANHWLALVALGVLNLAASPLALLTPLPIKIVVDNVLGRQPSLPLLNTMVGGAPRDRFELLVVAMVLLVVVVILTELQDVASEALGTLVGERVTLGFRARLFNHVQRLSVSFHDFRGTADSIYRIQYDAPSLQYLTIGAGIPLVAAAVTLASMLYVTFRIDATLALIALAVTPVLFLLSSSYNQRMRRRYRGVKELEASALQVVQEVLTALRVVKAFGRHEGELERFVRQSGLGVRARVRLTLAEGVFGLLVSLTTAVGSALVLLVGVQHVQRGSLSLGSLLVVVAYLSQLYRPLTTTTKKVADVQMSLAGAERAFELLDEIPDVAERPGAIAIRRAAGGVEFRDVTFSYNRVTEVLRGTSFSVGAGSRVGLIGRTGAGKTTLISLLLRFYDPSGGRILLDGVDLRDYRLDDLRRQFALVLQEPLLFSTTILENIEYARPGATREATIEAAKAADAHDFISLLPDAYETQVGERGMLLSGGERQRISLARAFLKDAPVLLLDEPTSSVDSGTEAAIVSALDRLMAGRTTIVISHRLSTLSACDELLELSEGSVHKATAGFGGERRRAYAE